MIFIFYMMHDNGGGGHRQCAIGDGRNGTNYDSLLWENLTTTSSVRHARLYAELIYLRMTELIAFKVEITFTTERMHQ